MQFSDLVGKVIRNIEVTYDSACIIFHCTDGSYRLAFIPESDSHCSIDNISGELLSIVGSPITKIEEFDWPGLKPKYVNDESWTWNSYSIATNDSECIITWYGCSDGQHCDTPTFGHLTPLGWRNYPKDESLTASFSLR